MADAKDLTAYIVPIMAFLGLIAFVISIWANWSDIKGVVGK